MMGFSREGRRDRKNLVRWRYLAALLLSIRDLADIGGGHNISQSFSTRLLKSVHGSWPYLRVELSDFADADEDEELRRTIASDSLSCSLCSELIEAVSIFNLDV